MIDEELSKDDKTRVNGCDFYSKTKEVMLAHERYKTLQIGEVYFIKRTNTYDKTSRYLSRSIGQAPSKYMVFHKDADDFVFIKRINANGKLGKIVECLQTQYSAPCYDIEPDPEYVESIIFEEEGTYDPLKAEKEIVKKKGQARRKNKKLEIGFDTDQEALNHLRTFCIGDRIFDAGTTYGCGAIEWKVINIAKRPVDQTPQTSWRGSGATPGNTHYDQLHNRAGLNEFISVTVQRVGDVPKTRRWAPASMDIIFRDLVSQKGHTYYKSKMWTVDDV